MARSALEPLRPRLEASGVAVDVEIAAGVMARADREKMRQVVDQPARERGRRVGASAGQARRPRACTGATRAAVLEVRDSGPGVPADALPRLFEPFFSLKTTGTGLGLAIVKRTVEAHGGRVEARPAGAGGLLLRVELPAVRPWRRRDRRGRGSMTPRILVVDDERTIGLAIQRLLERARLRRRDAAVRRGGDRAAAGRRRSTSSSPT